MTLLDVATQLVQFLHQGLFFVQAVYLKTFQSLFSIRPSPDSPKTTINLNYLQILVFKLKILQNYKLEVSTNGSIDNSALEDYSIEKS